VSAPTREALAELAGALEGKPPEEILAAAAARFGKIALACSFGEEDCLLVDAVARARVPVEIFTLDTGFLFPETYGLWRELEGRYGIVVHAVAPVGVGRPGPDETPPWAADPDGCCDARKVVPLRQKLATLDAWVTGIRRDQTPERANAKVIEWDGRFGLVKVNPLVAFTRDQVLARLAERRVPTNPLHAQGFLSIGCAPCTTPVRPGEDPRAGRWRGQEKKECGLHWPRTPGGGKLS
jgi:phosphoadenosine phosphosulfate reductase